jgi:diguanylate cyclase (GGDEF)-like protein/PAS domain S-box-containing protein/putative nucleotidyltransferase with HDIG domain
MSFALDITEKNILEIESVRGKNLINTTLSSIIDGVISCDENGKIILMNSVAEELTGWSHEDVIDRKIEDVFNVVDEFSREKRESIIKKVIESKKINEIEENTILISKDGIETPIEDCAAPILNGNGDIEGVVLIFRDYSAKKQKLDQIKYLSYHDQLTGIYNRKFYEEELIRLDIERNLPLSIIIGDVNGLKLINDSFGHGMGDELLKKASQLIKMGCRGDEIIARLGSDEFIVLLPKTDSPEAEKIIARIKDLMAGDTLGGIDISISFGYSTKREKNEGMDEIFKKAEDHMYQEKLFESPNVKDRTINAILDKLHEKNIVEMRHAEKVAKLSESMGREIGLNEEKIETLKKLGLLHDIGEIAIEKDIFEKEGELTENERSEIKKHPEIGYRILSTVKDMTELAEYVLYHHEQWNGKGYPRGLKAEEIPIEARIIAIADAYEAMTSDRSYRVALPIKVVIDELEKNAGIQFDPELVFIFVKKVIGDIEQKSQ